MKFFVAFLSVVAIAHANLPKLDGRIVGGHNVDIIDYPYQVSLCLSDKHICGGSILDASTILTAANCVFGKDPNKFTVRVGNTQHALGTSIRVEKVIANKDYDSKTFNNDMAILKLASRITFDRTAQAVALQRQGEDVAPGTLATVSGWGALQDGSESLSPSLRAVNVSIISNTACSDKYGSGLITAHMLCAQTLDNDFCYGDTGGPLVVDSRLIGVVSWGYGCANPRFPGVYAKVSDMYSWIINNRD